MYHVTISSSGGFSLEAECYEDYEYYSKATFCADSPLQAAIWRLGVSADISGFKDRWRIHKIIHLSLGPCGIHQFTIENDEFEFRLGKTLQEQIAEDVQGT